LNILTIRGLILICDQVGGKHAEKAMRLLREVMPAAADEHARPGNQNARKKAEAENAGDNVARVSHGSNSPNEILRRLKRDHKELAAKVVSGEMSAHAAGIEAGFVKPVVSHRPTVQGFLSAALAHLSPEQRLELKESLHKSLLKDICDAARPSKSGNFCRQLLAELLRRRKEIHDKNAKGRWLPENVSKIELTVILDWVQHELETFNGAPELVAAMDNLPNNVQPGLGSSLPDHCLHILDGIRQRQAEYQAQVQRTRWNLRDVAAMQAEKWIAWAVTELEKVEALVRPNVA
jgi:hypothetical protein